MSFIVGVLAFLSIFVAAHFLLPRKKFVTFYLVSAALFGLIDASELSDSFRLYRGQTETRGIVTHTNCGNHGHFTYNFLAGDISNSHEIPASRGGLHCEDIRIGEQVTVQYLIEDPEISMAGSSRHWFFESLEFTLFLMFGMPALWLYFYFRKKSKAE